MPPRTTEVEPSSFLPSAEPTQIQQSPRVMGDSEMQPSPGRLGDSQAPVPSLRHSPRHAPAQGLTPIQASQFRDTRSPPSTPRHGDDQIQTHTPGLRDDQIQADTSRLRDDQIQTHAPTFRDDQIQTHTPRLGYDQIQTSSRRLEDDPLQTSTPLQQSSGVQAQGPPVGFSADDARTQTYHRSASPSTSPVISLDIQVSPGSSPIMVDPLTGGSYGRESRRDVPAPQTGLLAGDQGDGSLNRSGDEYRPGSAGLGRSRDLQASEVVSTDHGTGAPLHGIQLSTLQQSEHASRSRDVEMMEPVHGRIPTPVGEEQFSYISNINFPDDNVGFNGSVQPPGVQVSADGVRQRRTSDGVVDERAMLAHSGMEQSPQFREPDLGMGHSPQSREVRARDVQRHPSPPVHAASRDGETSIGSPPRPQRRSNTSTSPATLEGALGVHISGPSPKPRRRMSQEPGGNLFNESLVGVVDVREKNSLEISAEDSVPRANMDVLGASPEPRRKVSHENEGVILQALAAEKETVFRQRFDDAAATRVRR